MAVFRPPTWIEYTRHKSFCFIGAQNEQLTFLFSVIVVLRVNLGLFVDIFFRVVEK